MHIHPPSLPDPLRMKPLALSLDAVVTWLDAVGARPEPASPLAFLTPAPRPTAEPRCADARAELARHGIVLEPHPGQRTPLAGAYWMGSLQVLAAPRARLRLAVWTEDRGMGLFPFFLTRNWAVYFAFDEARFHIGPPLPLDTLKAALVRHLAVRDDQLRARNTTVLGTAFRWLVYLWIPEREVLDPTLDAAVLRKRLAKAPVSHQDLDEVLALLVELGYVARDNGRLRLVAPYDHWIRMVASGQALELEMTWFPPGTPEAAPRERLLFVGPRHTRALLRGISLDLLEGSRVSPPAAKVPAASEPALMLAHLGLGEALQLVDTLVTP